MQQKFKFLFLTGLFCAIGWSLTGHTPMEFGLGAPNPNCQLPPPQNLQAGNVGPTSIELLWNPPASVPPGVTVTYKISMFDITDNVALADAHTTALNFLYDGLTPGHWYQASVSASACGAGGPTGPAAVLEVQTGIIIVDDIAQLEIPANSLCEYNPQQLLNLSKGTTIDLALPAFTPPSTSGFGPFGKLKLETKNGLIWVEMVLAANNQNHPVVFETGSEGVVRQPEGLGQFGEITYGKPNEFEFFRLFDPRFNYHLPTVVHLRVECLEDCTLWYCGLNVSYSDAGVMVQPSQDPLSVGGVAAKGLPSSAEPNRRDVINELIIAPNPGNGLLSLRFNLLEESEVALQIDHLTGKSAYRTSGASQVWPKGEHELQADLANLPNGVYLVRLKSPKQVVQQLYVKQ